MIEEWIEYFELEPWGAWRDNWHSAVIATILANVYRKPNSSPIPMHEFFYEDSRTIQERREKQMISWLGSFKPKNSDG